MSCCGCLSSLPGLLVSPHKEDDIIPEGAVATQFTDHECGVDFPSGGNEARAWRLPLSGKVGMMHIELETYSQKDRMLFWLDRKLVLDTGCVGTGDDSPPAPFTKGNKFHWGCDLYIPKASRYLWVEVRPNCKGGGSTAWKLNIKCPDGRVAINDKELTIAYRTYNHIDSGNIQHITPVWS